MSGISSRQMQASDDKEQGAQSLLQLFLFSPVGNPLDSMNAIQRQFFFNSMFRMLQLQSAENEQRVRQLSGKMLPPLSAAGPAVRKFSMGGKKGQGKNNALAQKAPGAVQQASGVEKLILRMAVRAKKHELEKEAQKGPAADRGANSKIAGLRLKALAGFRPAENGTASHVFPNQKGGSAAPLLDSPLRMMHEAEKEKVDYLASIVFKEKAMAAKKAQMELAAMLDDYARGDAEKAEVTLSEFARRLSEGDYRADELGAVLLLVIEDQIWAGEEGGTESARPGGSSSRVKSAIPEKIMQSAQESAVLRLASVREMLRYYFQKRPEDFRGALVIALGITGADAEDDAVLRARMASEATEIGSFALSQKILSAVKKMRGMDTKKCLFELGYRYDKAQKKLIVGKRTCGKPSEARGIISALLSKFKKPGGK